MIDKPINAAELPLKDWELGMAFYASGYVHGLEVGRQHERDEVAALQREAARVVHALADVPTRDQAADRTRAGHRAKYWAARRGEVA